MTRIVVISEDELRQMIAEAIRSEFEKMPKPIQQPTKQSYTSRELQTLFNVSVATIWNWEKKKLLKPIVVSRKKTYLAKDIQQLIERKSIK